MSRFVLEALVIGVKEGLKLSACAFLVLSYLRQSDRTYLRAPFLVGLLAVLLATFGVMTVPVSPEARDMIVRLIGYVFGLFFLFSLAALFHTTGTDLLGPLAGRRQNRIALISITTFLTILYFAPDMLGATLFVADIAVMADMDRSLYLVAAAGFGGMMLLAAGIIYRSPMDTARFFDLPQVLLVLALVKLVGGGVRGFAELSLIPAVQAGLMKFVHDVVHQVLVLLLVPDHPILSTTTWNFVGVLFGETAGLWLSLLLLTLPLVLFIRRHFTASITVPDEVAIPARKRIWIKAVRDLRVQRSVPVLLFLMVIAGLWFSQKGASLNPLYLPEPKPVVPDAGAIVIPLQSPIEDLRDGAIHKFITTVDQREVKILVLKRPDGTLAVCLDACEICAPDGYGQGREHVVCLYCRTPIPFGSVGDAGGCNPIPVEALITDKEMRIKVEELKKKRGLIQSKQGAEGGR
jgi:hypothetical protein